MASTYVTEALAGPTSARGSTYSYTYESHYDEPPHESEEEVNPYAVGDSEVERLSTQTQKVGLWICHQRFVPYSDSELLALGIDLAREKSSGTRGSSYDTPPPAPNNAYENEIYGGTTSAQYGRFCTHLIVFVLLSSSLQMCIFAWYAFEKEWNC
uniref:Uncharacterized protein n=1 Tax=Parascaris equorum TaxID=6256 RepID=A0A914S0H8_PAREQ